MPPRFARGNRDKNEPQITEVLRRMNVRHVLLPEGSGADLLVYLSPLYLIEVKNPEVPKSDQKLSKLEEETKEYCEQWKIPYYVVMTPEDMAKIINDWIENSPIRRRNESAEFSK